MQFCFERKRYCVSLQIMDTNFLKIFVQSFHNKKLTCWNFVKLSMLNCVFKTSFVRELTEILEA